MKPRRVMLTLECMTDAPLSVLQCAQYYPPLDVVRIRSGGNWLIEVLQAQANVVEPKKSSGLGKTSRIGLDEITVAPSHMT